MVLRSVAIASALIVAASTLADAQRARSGRGFARDTEDVVFRGRGGPRPLMYGFALECTGCSRFGDASGMPPVIVWRYTDYPTVVAVARGGAADKADVKVGDIIMAIDGLSLLTDAGARRFSGVQPGDEVTLTVDRKAKGKLFDLKLALRRMGVPANVTSPPTDPRPARFTRRVGESDVEVFADQPVFSSTDSTGVTILTIGTTTVRIRPRGKP